MVKKKLLYIIHGMKVGGVEIAFVSAIQTLFDEFNLKVIVLGDVHPGLLDDHIRQRPDAFTFLSGSPALMPLNIIKCMAIARQFKPDLMISSLWRSAMAATSIKKLFPSTKFIAFIHSTTFFHHLDAFFTSHAIRSADIVFVDSGAGVNFVRNIEPNKPVSVVSFLTLLTPLEPKALPYVVNQPLRCMFLGRINKVKQLGYAVDLITSMRKQGIDITLDIYGRDDGDLANVENVIKKNEMDAHISLMGEYPPKDRQQLFEKYHGFIQLSINEGMAMSVAEAMQHGLVCFVTSVGEIPNYSRNMQSAVYLDCSTPASWTNSIQAAVSVAGSEEKWNYISRMAHSSFMHKKRYTESLKENLYNVL